MCLPPWDIVEPRHACDQGDNLDTYTWTEYDTREGGVQVLQDSVNNVKLTTEFLKVAGGDHGGSWAARVKGEPLNPGTCGFCHWVNLIWCCISELPSRISTIFYFGLEGLGGLEMETDENENVWLFHGLWLSLLNAIPPQGIRGEYKIFGSTPELDDFYIRVVDGN